MAKTLQFRTASEGSAIGIAVNDLTGRFLLVNRAFCEITGYSEQELMFRTYQSITHPDDLASNLRLARRMFAGEVRSIVYKKRYIRKDSAIVWVRNNVSMFHDSTGKPVRAIALAELITQAQADDAQPESEARKFHLISRTLCHPEEEERRRIARDLHDSTGQLLAGLVMTLTRLQSSPFKPLQREHLVAEALELARQCSREVRTLSYLLHPPLLEEFGLVTALQTYVEGFRSRTGIDLKLDVPPNFGRLPYDVETAIFRIVQEGLANIHKHSRSSRASVTLERHTHGAVLELRDWGRGLLARSVGVGLASMRERAQLVAGRFKVSSGRDGTRITVTLPLSVSDEEDAHSDRR